MNAIIMAGGFGNRLRPLTDTAPKPMLNVCNRPVIDYSVAQLYKYGIKDIVFSLGYMPDRVTQWVEGYSGITPHYFVEDTPLGTLGGVKAAAGKLSDTFIVLSGDGINDIDLSAMIETHKKSKAMVTIAVKKVVNPALYGVAQLNEDGFIKSFVEKPHDIITPSYVNCGTYIVSKSALGLVKKETCDFARDLFPLLVADKKIAYYRHGGYWQDIGDFASYYAANFEMFKPFFISPSSDLDEKYRSRTTGGSLPSVISRSASVFGVISGCVIGHGSKVTVGSVLENCIVLDGAVAEGRYKGCIIGGGFCIDAFSGANSRAGSEAGKSRDGLNKSENITAGI